MLIVNANRPVAIDTLIGAAWDQRPPQGARATLHAYISNLRRLMSSAGIDRAALASTPPGYQLVSPTISTTSDVLSPRRMPECRPQPPRQFEQAGRHLAAALAQWRGPVLEDLRDFDSLRPWPRRSTRRRLLSTSPMLRLKSLVADRYRNLDLEALTATHGYREPLWAQLITAYYLADRQSDALDAYLRLKTLLAEDLGIDPGWTIRELHQRILRQEPLDVRKVAQSHAEDTIVAQSDDAIGSDGRPRPHCVERTDERYALAGTATRIGRSPDNDIVLSDSKVSRHHAVVTDDGTTFLITDLGSANGVRVRGRRIDPSSELREGDRIRIGDQEFTLETEPRHAT